MMAPSAVFFSGIYLMSFMLVMSCDDWFLVWLGLEVNMFSFIVLMYKRGEIYSIESCMKYFFVQSLGSAIIMVMFYFNSEILYKLSSLVVSYKMGGGPFYFWFPSVCEGISWGSCFILMTLQKIIPLMLMVVMFSFVLWVVAFLSLLLGALGSFNQSNLKRLLAYSSVHHIGWLIMCHMINSILWMVYLFMYSIVILGIIMILKENEINFISKLMVMNKKWLFFMGILSLAGVPPLMGFFLKWMALYYIMMLDFSLVLVMILFSVVMLYIYVRMVYDVMMGLKMEVSWGTGFEVYYHFLKYDLLSLGGLIFGGFLGLVFMN